MADGFVTGGHGRWIASTSPRSDDSRVLFDDWWTRSLSSDALSPWSKGRHQQAPSRDCHNVGIALLQSTISISRLWWCVGGDYMKPNERTWYRRIRHRLDHRSDVLNRSHNHTTPRLPLLRSLRPHHQNLDHRRPQRHRHLPRRRPQLEPLKPTPTEPQDADKNWNALSLPFVVGPKGRIGKLRATRHPYCGVVEGGEG